MCYDVSCLFFISFRRQCSLPPVLRWLVPRQPILRLIAMTMQAMANGAWSLFAGRSLLFAKLAKKRSVACLIDKNICSMRKIDFYLCFLFGLFVAGIPSGYGFFFFLLRKSVLKSVSLQCPLRVPACLLYVFGFRNGPFCLPIRAVSPSKTSRFGRQNGSFCNPLKISVLCDSARAINATPCFKGF